MLRRQFAFLQQQPALLAVWLHYLFPPSAPLSHFALPAPTGTVWQYYSLLRDALDPRFASTPAAKALPELERALKRLSREQVGMSAP